MLTAWLDGSPAGSPNLRGLKSWVINGFRSTVYILAQFGAGHAWLQAKPGLAKIAAKCFGACLLRLLGSPTRFLNIVTRSMLNLHSMLMNHMHHCTQHACAIESWTTIGDPSKTFTATAMQATGPSCLRAMCHVVIYVSNAVMKVQTRPLAQLCPWAWHGMEHRVPDHATPGCKSAILAYIKMK